MRLGKSEQVGARGWRNAPKDPHWAQNVTEVAVDKKS